jgi:hypothetical protein
MLQHSLSCGIIYGGASGHFTVPTGYALQCRRRALRALIYHDANKYSKIPSHFHV